MDVANAWYELNRLLDALIQLSQQPEEQAFFCEQLVAMSKLLEKIELDGLGLADDVLREEIQSKLNSLADFLKTTLPVLQDKIESIHSSSNSLRLNKVYG